MLKLGRGGKFKEQPLGFTGAVLCFSSSCKCSVSRKMCRTGRYSQTLLSLDGVQREHKYFSLMSHTLAAPLPELLTSPSYRLFIETCGAVQLAGRFFRGWGQLRNNDLHSTAAVVLPRLAGSHPGRQKNKNKKNPTTDRIPCLCTSLTER